MLWDISAGRLRSFLQDFRSAATCHGRTDRTARCFDGCCRLRFAPIAAATLHGRPSGTRTPCVPTRPRSSIFVSCPNWGTRALTVACSRCWQVSNARLETSDLCGLLLGRILPGMVTRPSFPPLTRASLFLYVASCFFCEWLQLDHRGAYPS